MIPNENPSPTTSPAQPVRASSTQDDDSHPERSQPAAEPSQPSTERALTVQRIDRPKFESSASAAGPNLAAEETKKHNKSKPSAKASRRPDPVMQSMMLLLTMGVMLMAARFAVPRIVEEIRYAWHRGQLRV